jgi:hypothetical protein
VVSGAPPAGDADRPALPRGVLDELDGDAWAQVLRAVRSVIGEGAVTHPQLAELAAMPVGRLVGGQPRRRLTAVLSTDPEIAAAVRQRLHADGHTALEAHLAADPAAVTTEATGGAAGSVQQAKRRSQRLRRERDDWRRRAEGAEVRVRVVTDELEELRRQHAVLVAENHRLADDLAEAEEARRRAVAREQRRAEGELNRLRNELAELRRVEESRRVEEARRTERRRDDVSRRDTAASGGDGVDGGSHGFVPGRPSRLPPDVARGTTEEVVTLLHPGRHVLVDGYNVTRRHRSQLDLEAQRRWLVQLVAQAARVHRFRPVVVFDGSQESASRPAAGGRTVEVRFTPAGITADDEIVLDVEATDAPVLVVTDDRELQDRCRDAGADVVAVTPFLGALTSPA